MPWPRQKLSESNPSLCCSSTLHTQVLDVHDGWLPYSLPSDTDTPPCNAAVRPCLPGHRERRFLHGQPLKHCRETLSLSDKVATIGRADGETDSSAGYPPDRVAVVSCCHWAFRDSLESSIGASPYSVPIHRKPLPISYRICMSKHAVWFCS